MRINVYSQELTDEVQTVGKVSNTGLTYSAVTSWLPKSKRRREALAIAFEEMATKVRDAKPETGLD